MHADGCIMAVQALLMTGQAKCHLAGHTAHTQQYSGNGISNALAVYTDLDMLLMDEQVSHSDRQSKYAVLTGWVHGKTCLAAAQANTQ